MKYAFVSFLVPECISDEVRRKSRGNMQDSANALQWSILQGLVFKLKEEIKLFNTLPISSYPKYYTDLFVPRFNFETRNCGCNVNVPFVNAKLIKKFFIYRSLCKELKKWACESDEAKTIFVYSAPIEFIAAVNKIKKLVPNTKVCVILADLPDMLTTISSDMTFIHKLLDNFLAKVSYSMLSQMDYFVLLTKHMAEYLKIKKPFTVMEGICTTTHPVVNTTHKESGIKTLLYTGLLHKKYGILRLIKAFQSIPNTNYRLEICGVGDSESVIKELAKEDKRIIFKGQVSREEALRLQVSADVLVNPRQNTEEFTKYSFPSKNLEYLSSGTPLVAYKLDGIPDEYDEYINYVNDNSIESLANLMLECAEDKDGSYLLRAKLAATFVKSSKSANNQAKAIYEMICK